MQCSHSREFHLRASPHSGGSLCILCVLGMISDDSGEVLGVQKIGVLAHLKDEAQRSLAFLSDLAPHAQHLAHHLPALLPDHDPDLASVGLDLCRTLIHGQPSLARPLLAAAAGPLTDPGSWNLGPAVIARLELLADATAGLGGQEGVAAVLGFMHDRGQGSLLHVFVQVLESASLPDELTTRVAGLVASLVAADPGPMSDAAPQIMMAAAGAGGRSRLSAARGAFLGLLGACAGAGWFDAAASWGASHLGPFLTAVAATCRPALLSPSSTSGPAGPGHRPSPSPAAVATEVLRAASLAQTPAAALAAEHLAVCDVIEFLMEALRGRGRGQGPGPQDDPSPILDLLLILSDGEPGHRPGVLARLGLVGESLLRLVEGAAGTGDTRGGGRGLELLRRVLENPDCKAPPALLDRAVAAALRFLPEGPRGAEGGAPPPSVVRELPPDSLAAACAACSILAIPRPIPPPLPSSNPSNSNHQPPWYPPLASLSLVGPLTLREGLLEAACHVILRAGPGCSGRAAVSDTDVLLEGLRVHMLPAVSRALNREEGPGAGGLGGIGGGGIAQADGPWPAYVPLVARVLAGALSAGMGSLSNSNSGLGRETPSGPDGAQQTPLGLLVQALVQGGWPGTLLSFLEHGLTSCVGPEDDRHVSDMSDATWTFLAQLAAAYPAAPLSTSERIPALSEPPPWARDARVAALAARNIGGAAQVLVWASGLPGGMPADVRHLCLAVACALIDGNRVFEHEPLTFPLAPSAQQGLSLESTIVRGYGWAWSAGEVLAALEGGLRALSGEAGGGFAGLGRDAEEAGVEVESRGPSAERARGLFLWLRAACSLPAAVVAAFCAEVPERLASLLGSLDPSSQAAMAGLRSDFGAWLLSLESAVLATTATQSSVPDGSHLPLAYRLYQIWARELIQVSLISSEGPGLTPLVLFPSLQHAAFFAQVLTKTATPDGAVGDGAIDNNGAAESDLRILQALHRLAASDPSAALLILGDGSRSEGYAYGGGGNGLQSHKSPRDVLLRSLLSDITAEDLSGAQPGLQLQLGCNVKTEALLLLASLASAVASSPIDSPPSPAQRAALSLVASAAPLLSGIIRNARGLLDLRCQAESGAGGALSLEPSETRLSTLPRIQLQAFYDASLHAAQAVLRWVIASRSRDSPSKAGPAAGPAVFLPSLAFAGQAQGPQGPTLGWPILTSVYHAASLRTPDTLIADPMDGAAQAQAQAQAQVASPLELEVRALSLHVLSLSLSDSAPGVSASLYNPAPPLANLTAYRQREELLDLASSLLADSLRALAAAPPEEPDPSAERLALSRCSGSLSLQELGIDSRVFALAVSLEASSSVAVLTSSGPGNVDPSFSCLPTPKGVADKIWASLEQGAGSIDAALAFLQSEAAFVLGLGLSPGSEKHPVSLLPLAAFLRMERLASHAASGSPSELCMMAPWNLDLLRACRTLKEQMAGPALAPPPSGPSDPGSVAVLIADLGRFKAEADREARKRSREGISIPVGAEPLRGGPGGAAMLDSNGRGAFPGTVSLSEANGLAGATDLPAGLRSAVGLAFLSDSILGRGRGVGHQGQGQGIAIGSHTQEQWRSGPALEYLAAELEVWERRWRAQTGFVLSMD